MSYSLQTDLRHPVGSSVNSSNGKYLGKIAGITRDEAGKYIEYLILESDGFLDNKERFFAIPASTAFIKLTESKNIILNLSKEALHFAKRIVADKCPKPDFKNGASLYELI
ncbi:MAG TPA: PRC-barrel domain-containing protein [Balneolaceae bacterium]|nr:PRC-barrel domain-containing protein [Balneolaceae bacterium]